MAISDERLFEHDSFFKSAKLNKIILFNSKTMSFVWGVGKALDDLYWVFLSVMV